MSEPTEKKTKKKSPAEPAPAPAAPQPTGNLMVGLITAGAAAAVVAVIVISQQKANLTDDDKPAGRAPSAQVAEQAPPATAAPNGEPPSGDPLNGKFTMADATKDLPGSGPLTATIDTSLGSLSCKLFDDKAPNTVANFIGLATGKRTWKDTGGWVNRPAYDGTTFHRIIKGFMIQGGDQRGNGSGEPGYVINDEIWPGAKHDRAGLLCMANRGHNTNGAQFFITDDAAAHLDNNYTIFGECSPVDVVHTIANTPVRGEKPATPVTIKSVKIRRGA